MLTCPTVTELLNFSPRILPIATASSPALTESLSPIGTALSPRLSTLSTAISVLESPPTFSATCSCPSGVVTLMRFPSATTWLLVRIYPSSEITKPVPASSACSTGSCPETSCFVYAVMPTTLPEIFSAISTAGFCEFSIAFASPPSSGLSPVVSCCWAASCLVGSLGTSEPPYTSGITTKAVKRLPTSAAATATAVIITPIPLFFFCFGGFCPPIPGGTSCCGGIFCCPGAFVTGWAPYGFAFSAAWALPCTGGTLFWAVPAS